VSDGVNGSFIAWQDRRNGTTDKIYLQRMSSSGSPLWAAGGIPLSQTGGFQYYPQMVSDSAGGFFIAWQDNRFGVDYDIFAQHVASDGTLLWSQNGVLVCNAAGHQYNPQLVADGLGGIVITWQDHRAGQFDIYAQRLDANGSALWATNGQTVCNSPNDQLEPKLVADGNGGAVVVWIDYRAGNGFTDLFCQRLLPNGTAGWTSNGVAVCVAPNMQWNTQMSADGLGNCIITWQDRRAGTYDNIYAQKINMNGVAVWGTDGVALAPVSGPQYYPQIAGDHHGGAVVVWQDNRLGADYNIYGQHVDANGSLLWSSLGLAVCTAAGHQYNPQIIEQGAYDIVAWQDKRGGDFDVYAQRIGVNGNTLWDVNGINVTALNDDQFMPELVSDGVNGAIIAWADYHLGGTSTDIFSQRIGANGKPAGGCFRTFTQDVLSLKAKNIRSRSFPYAINSLPTEGNVRDTVFGRGAFSQGLVIGIERRDSARAYGWEYFTRSLYVRRALVQNGDARPFDRIYERNFTGLVKNASVGRYNNRLAGELLALRINIAASDAGITESHFGDLVYRDTSRVKNPLNNRSLRDVANKVDTMLTYWRRTPGADYPQLYRSLYQINSAFFGTLDTLSSVPMRLTAKSALFSVPYLIPGSNPPPPIPVFYAQSVEPDEPNRFALYQNYPNPFNPMTTIEFTLPEFADVSLKIYNVLGQQVATIFDHAAMDAGHQVADFDASLLSSGVYFYQLVADPVSAKGKLITQSKKMVLIK
jgi:hypothetical protein